MLSAILINNTDNNINLIIRINVYSIANKRQQLRINLNQERLKLILHRSQIKISYLSTINVNNPRKFLKTQFF